jgi:peptidyl-prolyl cis-trans isomerase B (cyclophilin B)
MIDITSQPRQLLSGLLIIFCCLLLASDSRAQQRRPKGKAKAPAAAAKPTPAPVPAVPEPPPPPPEPPTIRPPATPLTVEEMARLQAVLETSMGNITLEFYPQSAPNHVRQFVWLAREGYFDGMSISRVIPLFIIQSGNPASWEEANANQKKRFEIPQLKAEYDTNIKHDRGALSLARPNGEPDAGTTHFFICARKATSLDNQYSIFGHVVNGYEVVDAISAVAIAEGTPDKPRDRIELKRVVIKEKEAVTPAASTQP